jgi:hypothetical protein
LEWAAGATYAVILDADDALTPGRCAGHGSYSRRTPRPGSSTDAPGFSRGMVLRRR